MAFCSNCGNALAEGQTFCTNCGQPVGQAAAPQGAVPPPPSLAPPAPPAPPAPYAPYSPGQPYAQGMYPAQQPRKGKGLWITLASALLVVVVACVLVFVVFRDDIFNGDSASGPNGTVAGQTNGDAPTPNAVMAKATAALGTTESQTGSFEAKISFDVDSSVLGEEEAAFFADPWTLGGTMAYQSGTQAGDFTVSLGMMGQTMELGIKLLGDKAWVKLADQWYEAPPDTQQQLADAGVASTLTQIQQLINELAIDPITWLQDQDPVKEEKIDGVAVYHLSGSNPDWAKIVSDLAAVSQSPAFQSLMSGAGSTASSLEEQLPSAEELAQMQEQFASLFSDVKIDLWLEKDTGVLRKATFAASIVPPEDPSALSGDGSASGLDLAGSGISGVHLEATLELDPNRPVSVEAPGSALTYEEFQTAIEENPELLGPLGSMLSGGL
ncbi:MAG: hypothetical protein A2133_04655 [Actinobacteria bacterium RBG_16_64_13]|nr:MAG: hypothetical protein A2133_04655 [Actinobacteria bacterium RBG_16_64_13]